MGTSSILITGGAGFIGSEFVRQSVLDSAYDKIYIVDSLTYAADLTRLDGLLSNPKVELIICDINNTRKYEKVLKEVDFIVHFAAESHVDRSNQDGIPFLQSNVVGTFKLLESARQNGKCRILLVSTDEVYGSINHGEFTESSPLRPSSAYSASKTSADLFALAMWKTFKQDIVITRGCNTYGPHQHAEKLIPLTINKLLDGEKAPIYGDGTNIREWIHVSDHARAINLVLKNGKTGEAYNVGSGSRFSNKEVLNRILMKLHLDESSMEYVKDRPGHDFRYALDSRKIKHELGWEPEIDFLIGIDKTIDWYVNEKENK